MAGKLIHSAIQEAVLSYKRCIKTAVLTGASHEDSHTGLNKQRCKGGWDAQGIHKDLQSPTENHQELCWEAGIPNS